MKALLHLENLAKVLAAYWFSLHLGYSWWVFLAWFLAPDVSMIGYLVNPRIGAWLYNLAHHQAVALAVLFAGILASSAEWQFAGALLFGHSAFDRIFGYGLKFSDDFKHTHLGWIGKRADE